jgi:DNA-binding TFAR19-related protein (PDSD5 family)
LNELDVVKNADEFRQGIIDLANKTDAALTAIQTRESDAEIERLRYIELVNAGLTDTVAQKVLELEAAKRVTSAIYDAAIAQLESKIIAGDVTDQVNAQNEAYRQQIEILRQRKDAQEGKFGTFDATTGKGTGAIGGAVESESGKKLQDFIARTQAELNDLEGLAVRVSEGIGNAIANSLANGVAGLIEGTTTAKEVFANFLRDVGQILVQEGTKMIGMYFAIGIAKIFAGLSSGGNMGGKNYFDPMTGKGVAGPNFGLAKGGAFDESGNQRFAKGGTFTNSIVSSPTLFKFADGGAMRTGVMGEAGPEAIMPLKRNSSGRLGVEASGLREAMGSAPGNANSSPVLNMSFESTNIGGVEYVSRDQLEQAMAATRRQAANDGAKRGMSMTLDRLQQSPQTRRRVGI